MKKEEMREEHKDVRCREEKTQEEKRNKRKTPEVEQESQKEQNGETVVAILLILQCLKIKLSRAEKMCLLQNK